MSKHRCAFNVAERDENHRATAWRATCECKVPSWWAATYEAAEDEWRRHVHGETGKAPAPCGDVEGRWTP